MLTGSLSQIETHLYVSGLLPKIFLVKFCTLLHPSVQLFFRGNLNLSGPFRTAAVLPSFTGLCLPVSGGGAHLVTGR